MNTYLVELISDLDEQVSIYVDAYDESEAEAIGVTMLENGASSTVPGRFVQPPTSCIGVNNNPLRRIMLSIVTDIIRL